MYLPWRCIWVMSRLYTVSQVQPFPPVKLFCFVGNNSSPDWRRWSLEVRAFLWEYGDLHHSSHGEALCVACDTITHFPSGTLAIYAGSNYCRQRKDLNQGLPGLLSECFNLSTSGVCWWRGITFPGCVFCCTNPVGLANIHFTSEMGKALCAWWKAAVLATMPTFTGVRKFSGHLCCKWKERLQAIPYHNEPKSLD